MIFVRRLSLLILLIPGCILVASAQSNPVENPQRPVVPVAQATCDVAPREDALVSLCAPPSDAEEKQDEAASMPPAKIPLTIPSGTPIRLALDQRKRVGRTGNLVHGRVVETVYAFDQVVIPAGSIATGHLTRVAPVPITKRTLAYANGNFSPFHKYELTFDTLTLPDGNLQPGTRFVAELDAPLDFGATTRTAEQLALIGNAPMPDTTLKARLLAEVSSATATRGTPVTAVLTEPIYSAEHFLILPADSRLIGEVVQAKPAHKLHRNGELRVVFERIETSKEGVQALSHMQGQTEHFQASSQGMVGNLEGVEVDRSAHMKLDEEGGARTTDSKTRYLSTGLAVLLAAAAAHPDTEHGTTDAAGDPGVRTAAGGSGFRLTGAVLSLAAKSTPVSIAFGAYGASASIYSNFLSRGHDVVLPKDTPLEIGFGNPHPAAASQPKPQ